MTNVYSRVFADLPDNPEAAYDALSIVISPASLQFCIFEKNNVTAIAEYAAGQIAERTDVDGLGKIISDHRLGGIKFGSVNIAVLNRDFTLLPESFEPEDAAAEVLAFTSGRQVLNCMSEKVSGAGFCYTIDRELLTLCERTFPNAAIRHAGIVSLSLFFSHHSVQQSQVFISLHRGMMEIACRKDKKLSLYNVFNFETDEDALYYLMFTIEQLQFNPEYVQLAVAADLPVTHPLIVLIKKYIRNVSFVTRDNSLAMRRGAALPLHYYFTLLHHPICGL
jgi:hypothetical protein